MSISKTTGLIGLTLLRTCKKLNELGTPILYSNTFVFDTRGQEPFTNGRGVHEYNALSRYSHLIPGLPYPDGTPMSNGKIQLAIKEMFGGDIEHNSFLRRDPLVQFMRQIGPEKASLINAVKVEGFWKTAEAGKVPRLCPIGLCELLPIYTTILNKVCPNLHHLTIFQGPNAEF
ncbi:hypothetical protein BKA65DRAFT_487799 [Rhexocercosporidium sp. MPI-PUGE-AT-0058]|nr:hypothetical protein BKA65DRAFT_487799 [Rhexocercosporidium sp. MPI-PUGE-AT-0058]